MSRDSGSKKLVWTILFSLITIALCYLFIVVYFYFISPYNISLRLAFWPFVSESQVGQMYNEATVEVSFRFENDDLEMETISIVGVNLKKDGFVAIPYSGIANCNDYEQIKVLTKSGEIYAGRFLYGSFEYNLAIIKCENVDGGSKSINIPFVNLTSNYTDEQKIIISAPSINDSSSWTGKISDTTGYSYVSSDGGFNYCVEDGFLIKVDGSYSFVGGAIFDKNANLLGFSYNDTLSLDKNSETLAKTNEHYILPTYPLIYFFDDIVDSYKAGKSFENKLVDAFVGVDVAEAKVLTNEEFVTESDEIVYRNIRYGISNDLRFFVSSDKEGFFLLEKFEYGETSISANAVIVDVFVNGDKFLITEKIDIYSLAYLLQSGDKVKIDFQILDGANYKSDSRTFTI